MVGDPSYNIAALKVVISASVALAVMLIELSLLMGDEVKHIWPRLRSSWTSWMYIFCRYAGLICQIFNVYFSVRMYIGIYTSPNGCRLWFMYQAVVVQFLLASVEGLLMWRLYALFLQSRMILLVLISFIVAQVASMIVSARLSFPSNKYTISCWVTRSNPGNAFFSATTLTTNVIVFFMAFWRYLRLPTRWTREGLGRAILLDSGFSLAGISLVMLFLTLCSLEVIKPSMSGNVTFSWLVFILWASVGRIIVNHTKIPTDDQGVSTTWKETVQLTSQIEMGESTLSFKDALTDDVTTSTLQSSLRTPVTKGSQLSPSSVCTSNAPEWFGDVPLVHERACQRTSQPSNTTPAKGPLPHPSQASSSSGIIASTEDNSQAREDVPEHRENSSSGLQPSDTTAVQAPGSNASEPWPSMSGDHGTSYTGDHPQVNAETCGHSPGPCLNP